MMLSVHEVLNKLEPVMPKDVRAWRRGIEQGSPNTRLLIERHARILFLRTFPRGSLLLRPPPRNLFSGPIRLGDTLYSKPWGPFGLSPDELLQNLVILGRSGSGKTNVAFLLLDHLLKKKIPFLFFDWKRTCRDLLPAWPRTLKVMTPGRNVAPFHFNILSPPEGLEANVWARHVIDTIARAYTLGDGAKSLLQKALSTADGGVDRTLDLDSLLQVLNAMPATGRAHGWKVSAVRAIESLSLESTPPEGHQEESPSPVDLLTSATVLELDAVSANFKKCLIPLLCLHLFFTKLHSAKREKLSFVVFVEEAHHLLHRQSQSASESVMEMLIRQCREVGIALVVLDQHPHLLSPAVLGNSYASICLNLKDPRDIDRGSALSQLAAGDKSVLSRLPVGHGVVKTQDRWLSPFLVHFHQAEVKKGEVTDDEVRQLSVHQDGHSAPSVRPVTPASPLVTSRTWHQDHEEVFDLIADVLEHPADGVDRRYKRLGWSCDRGNRIKTACLSSDMLEAEFVATYGTRRLMLRPSRLARRFLNGNRNARLPESIAHEYWKTTLAELLTNLGYQTQVEAPCGPNQRVDILAKKDGLRLAVEIETGKSDTTKNVRKCLANRFHRIVVAATSREALGFVERRLATAGLLIPNRVDVVLATHLAQELSPTYRSSEVA